jgi:uncharacterized damage-inducible protein DinB
MLEYFKRLFEYEFWAIDKVFDSLTGIEMKPNEKLSKAVSHVILTNQTWLCRLQGKPNIDITRELDLSEGKKLSVQVREEWKTYLSSLTEEKFAQKISYVNFQNATYETALSDILAHVVNHGSYHRGQIASLIKQAGGGQMYSDYIGFVRK